MEVLPVFVEENAGDFIGWGIAAMTVGGAIMVATAMEALGTDEGPIFLGGLIVLVGLGLLLVGISKFARNVEVAAKAQVAAEKHQAKAVEELAKSEEHLRHLRAAVVTQFKESRTAARSSQDT